LTYSDKKWSTTLLLCIFFGMFGAHRFYTGHITVGIIQLFTFGVSGIWTLVDMVMIISGKFKDSNDALVKNMSLAEKYRNKIYEQTESLLELQLKDAPSDEFVENKKKIDTKLKKDIKNLLLQKGIKITVSDITAHLKHKDRDKIKELCEELYNDGEISFAGNSRYFILKE